MEEFKIVLEKTEKFCRECKREIKNISSRTELRELEQLIEAQKKFSPTSLLSRFLLPNFVGLNKTPKKL